MKIKFFGVRGSIPVPGRNTNVYGGNTSCVLVEVDNQTIIFDAGSGIRDCGGYFLGQGKKEATIFISHTHWDHIQGFPFFVPAYIPGNTFTVYGPPSDVHNLGIEQLMNMQTNYEFFPVRSVELKSNINYIDCVSEKVDINGIEIHTCRTNHPVACLAYKIIHDHKTVIYGGDHEPFRNVYRDSPDNNIIGEDSLEELDNTADEQNKRIQDFCREADIVIWDAQYSKEEYQTKKGWGHSYYEADMDLAEQASVKHMIFSHFDPVNTDSILSERETQFKKKACEKGFVLDFAREGMEIELP